MIELTRSKDNLYRESCPVIISSGVVLCDAERVFANLTIKNVSEHEISSIMLDIHIFDKANKEIESARDYLYLTDNSPRDAEFGSEIEVELSDKNAYTISVAVRRVTFEGDESWTGSTSILYETLPEEVLLNDLFEDLETTAQYQRDFIENFAEDKAVKPEVVPFEYKDLWCCSCKTLNNKSEENCHVCGAGFKAQFDHMNDRLQLQENLEEYKKALAKAAENARLEAKRKVDEAREAKEKAEQAAKEEKEKYEVEQIKLKRTRKIVIAITVPVLIMALIYAYLLYTYIIPNQKYEQAVELLEEESFDEAVTAFTNLNGYLDSAEMIIETKYINAQNLYDNKDYDNAVVIYESISEDRDVEEEIYIAKYTKAYDLYNDGDYEEAILLLTEIIDYDESQDLIDECNYELAVSTADDVKTSVQYFKLLTGAKSTALQEIYYTNGETYYNEESFDDAERYFSYITDSAIVEKVDELHYNKALFYIEEGNYDEAEVLLEELGSYSDCETLLLKIEYLRGDYSYSLKEYEDAIEHYTVAQDYEDSADKINLCNYQLAKLEFNAGEYEQAAEMFAELGDYSDSYEMYQEATYQFGVAQYNDGQITNSYYTLYEIKDYEKAYKMLISKSKYYQYVYDTGKAPNPLYE